MGTSGTRIEATKRELIVTGVLVTFIFGVLAARGLAKLAGLL